MVRRWLVFVISVAIIPVANVMKQNVNLTLREMIREHEDSDSKRYLSKEMFEVQSVITKKERERLELLIGGNTRQFEKVDGKLEALNLKLDASIVNQATLQQQMRAILNESQNQ